MYRVTRARSQGAARSGAAPAKDGHACIWDITLLGPSKWTYFYLYVDIFAGTWSCSHEHLIGDLRRHAPCPRVVHEEHRSPRDQDAARTCRTRGSAV